VNCVWYGSIVEAARVGGKTSLVEGYQILQCGEEYPGSVGRGSFPGYFRVQIRSSETSVLIRATRCHFPEDDNHHSHRRGNLKS
jgi:hypothetical protein